MSWGSQPQYGGYGQPAYGNNSRPPVGQYGQAPPPGGPGYGGAPPGGQYGAPPSGQGYGAPPGGQQSYGAPSGGQGYGAARPAYGGPTQGQPQGYGGPQGQYGQQPPQGYGGAPPQGQGQYGAPPSYGQQPPQAYGGVGGGGYSAPPPPGVNQEIWTWFQSVDADHSGKITAQELQQALTNGNWSHFNPETCRLMIGMFDRDRNGTIDVHEFAALWKYIQDWKTCFDRFDTDRSGTIDANEFGTALQEFGYRLSPQFSQTVIRVFGRKERGRCISFDDFIQASVMLKSLTDKFRAKDSNQNGTIQISYEDFLEMVLDTTLIK